MSAPQGIDESRRFERVDELPEVFFGDPLPLGDVLELNGPCPAVDGQIHHQPDAVSASGRQFHGWITHSSL